MHDEPISRENIIKTLKKAGAKSVKVLVTYAPIRHPCRAGIVFPTQEELLVHQTNEKFDDLAEINKKAKLIMTAKPHFISSDTLVGEALNIMNNKKITSLFVCENTKPVGIVHILDLLRLSTLIE